ncbi:C-type natriuretic peptide prohormone-like [Carcharodon carcharias]|uniref:C-type natriuretic peptide prohormone-like n=1 Tax=Carcharodon carcharias TaxID=13397 RepID=UPI001B7DFC0E|nr:C-type natriuretic peptide prohormone-like [Carcharodon carcharias]
MTANTIYYWGLLLLFLIQSQARPRPQNSLQTLSKLLEGELERYLSHEGLDNGADEASQVGISPDVQNGQSELERSWDENLQDLESRNRLPDGSLIRLLSDITNGPLRFKTRSKKVSTGGCFGVKLDRIGAMSDLGC